MKFLYYAHSKRTYGTRKEKKELRLIKKQFPGYKIINPAELNFVNMHENNIIDECKAIVRQVHTVIGSKFGGHVGRGVFEELAEKSRAKKYILRKKRFIENFSLRVVDKNDWRYCYGEIVES